MSNKQRCTSEDDDECEVLVSNDAEKEPKKEDEKENDNGNCVTREITGGEGGINFSKSRAQKQRRNVSTNSAPMLELQEACEDQVVNGNDISIVDQDSYNDNKLLREVKKGNSELVRKYLLEIHNINVNITDKNGCSALHLAVKEEYVKVAKYLLEHENINVNQADENGDNALIFAAESGDEDMMDLLLRHNKIDINHSNTNNENPVKIASNKGHLQCALKLFDQPIKPLFEESTRQDVSKMLMGGRKYKDAHNQALLVAARDNYTTILTWFLGFPSADVNWQDETGDCALLTAVEKGNKDAVTALIEHGTNLDVNIQDNIGYSALMWAADRGFNNIASVLLSIPGIDINLKDSDGHSALTWAAQTGHLQVLSQLTNNPLIDWNICGDAGVTPLIAAADKGQNSVVKYLLARTEEKVDVNKQDKNGYTALIWAADHNKLELVKMLSGRCDPNLQDKEGHSALIWAADRGNLEVVKILTNNKSVDVNRQDKDGYTALICAADQGHEGCAELLLRRRDIDVNLKDRQGRTALISSVVGGRLPVVRALLDHPKVNKDVKDGFGKTGLDWANELNRKLIAKRLSREVNFGTKGTKRKSKADPTLCRECNKKLV